MIPLGMTLTGLALIALGIAYDKRTTREEPPMTHPPTCPATPPHTGR